MYVRQPGLPTRGAQDHLVWQVDHHLAGEGGIGQGGGGGKDTSVEFEDGVTGAAVLKNCHTISKTKSRALAWNLWNTRQNMSN